MTTKVYRIETREIHELKPAAEAEEKLRLCGVPDAENPWLGAGERLRVAERAAAQEAKVLNEDRVKGDAEAFAHMVGEYKALLVDVKAIDEKIAAVEQELASKSELLALKNEYERFLRSPRGQEAEFIRRCEGKTPVDHMRLRMSEQQIQGIREIRTLENRLLQYREIAGAYRENIARHERMHPELVYLREKQQ